MVPGAGCHPAGPELLHLPGGSRQDGHRHTGSPQTPDQSTGDPSIRLSGRSRLETDCVLTGYNSLLSFPGLSLSGVVVGSEQRKRKARLAKIKG